MQEGQVDEGKTNALRVLHLPALKGKLQAIECTAHCHTWHVDWKVDEFKIVPTRMQLPPFDLQQTVDQIYARVLPLKPNDSVILGTGSFAEAFGNSLLYVLHTTVTRSDANMTVLSAGGFLFEIPLKDPLVQYSQAQLFIFNHIDEWHASNEFDAEDQDQMARMVVDYPKRK